VIRIRRYHDEPLAYCPACGLEIYQGEEVYFFPNGEVIHSSRECLEKYTFARVAVAEDVIGYVFRREAC
jgi:hypothetical protein